VQITPSTSVLVTGASSGIGAATAIALGSRGARIGIVARRNDRLDQVAEQALAAGASECQVWPCDLGDLDAAVRTAREADDHFGGLDVLVNNAAIPARVPVQELSNDRLDHVMRVNFTSPVRMGQALLPRFLDRDRGMIVNVSSMCGRVGIIQEAAYSASKYALCGWSESMAADLWNTGVDVRLIIPGPIDTEIWDQPDNLPAHFDGEKEPPSVAADAILAAIEGDRFETYVPDMLDIVAFKTTNIDMFLEGVANQ